MSVSEENKILAQTAVKAFEGKPNVFKYYDDNIKVQSIFFLGKTKILKVYYLILRLVYPIFLLATRKKGYL